MDLPAKIGTEEGHICHAERPMADVTWSLLAGAQMKSPALWRIRVSSS